MVNFASSENLDLMVFVIEDEQHLFVYFADLVFHFLVELFNLLRQLVDFVISALELRPENELSKNQMQMWHSWNLRRVGTKCINRTFAPTWLLLWDFAIVGPIIDR